MSFVLVLMLARNMRGVVIIMSCANLPVDNIPVIGCDEDGPYLVNPDMPADERVVEYFVRRVLDTIESAERWYLVDLSAERAALESESRKWPGMTRYEVNDAAGKLRSRVTYNHPRKVLRFWRVDWRVRDVMAAARFRPWYRLKNLTWTETRWVLAVVRKHDGDVDEINRRLAGLCVGR